jgi:hypothetical protein
MLPRREPGGDRKLPFSRSILDRVAALPGLALGSREHWIIQRGPVRLRFSNSGSCCPDVSAFAAFGAAGALLGRGGLSLARLALPAVTWVFCSATLAFLVSIGFCAVAVASVMACYSKQFEPLLSWAGRRILRQLTMPVQQHGRSQRPRRSRSVAPRRRDRDHAVCPPGSSLKAENGTNSLLSVSDHP